MSNRAQGLQKLLQVGSIVKIITKHKDEYQGLVLEHGDDYLILRDATGDESFVSYDDISSSKRLEANTSARMQLLTSSPAIITALDAEIPKPEQAIQHLPPVPLSHVQEVQVLNLDSEVVKRLQAIRKHFDDGTRFPKIGVRLPEFAFPAEELPGLEPKKAWERIENMYNYARKVNELTNKHNRIHLIASELKELCEKYPSSPGLKRQLTYFLLLAEKVPDALKYCTQAALTSHMASDWRNVAALAMRVGHGPQACYALDEFFQQNPINDDLEAWYLYVSLVRSSGDYPLLARFLDATRRILLAEEKQLLLETGIYVLLSTNREQIAQELMCQQLKGSTLDTLVQDVCNHFKGTLSEAYRRAISDLNDIKEQKKKEPPPAGPPQPERTAGEILKQAIALANDEGEYAQAIGELRQLWKLDPKYPGTQELSEKWRNALAVGAPKGSKPYARAKRLQLIEKNYDGAIPHFYEAIARNDKNTESAVKDLHNLLMQLNRPQDAVDVLVKYRRKVTDQQAVDVMLFSAYKKMMQYTKAIEILHRCIANATTNGRKIDFHQQMGNCYLRLEDYKSAEKWFREVVKLESDDKGPSRSSQRNLAFCLIKQNSPALYDEAEQILKGILPDTQADELLKAVSEARATGQAARIETDDIIEPDDIVIDTTLDSSGKMSDFVSFFLDQCEYEGVPSDRVQEKKFDRSDVQKLDIVATRLGARRPRERAEYYLSAAKIVSELVDEEWDNTNQMYKFLCRSFASRGDAAVVDKKAFDTIREYYSEALSVYDGDRTRNEVDARYSLVRYLSSLLGYSQIPMTSDIPNVDETLEKIFSLLQNEKVFDAISYLVYRSRFASSSVLKSLYRKPEFQEKARAYLRSKNIVGLDGASGLEEFVQQWKELGRRFANDIHMITVELGSIAKVELTTASVEDSLKRIRAVERRIFFDLDQQRVSKLQDILVIMSDLSKQIAFEEKERFCKQVEDDCRRLVLDIEENPTKLSIEVVLPRVKNIQEKIDKHLTEVYESSVPQLELGLAVESYSPDDSRKIEVQVVVENKMGCSPAESLELVVRADQESFTVSTQEIKLGKSLRGGEQEILIVPIRVTEQTLSSQTFSLPVLLRYRIRSGERSGERQEIPIQTFPVRLYGEEQFEHIYNPYTYASGSIVYNKEMFYGRTELISRVSDTICKVQSQGKAILIFGQKRSGKSSILHHLKKKLEEYDDLLILDIGDIGALLDPDSAPLLHQILWCIIYKLQNTVEDEEIRKQSKPLEISFPPDKEFYDHPSPPTFFKGFFATFKRAARKALGVDIKLVLLIDEFSYIFEKIIDGELSKDFMKNWKALLQDNFFSVVLVGQDVMPKFKQMFPNEFGTTEDERVSYLKLEDAIRLIDEPIRIGGKQGTSRYSEKALKRIIDLTAGSPFYIQIICYRLVDYMNSKRAARVTEADVEQVKNDLIRGVNRLDWDKFDNLISSGDTSRDAISNEDAKKVLTLIAVNSRLGSCARNAINCETKTPVDSILDDLTKRDVIERKKGDYYEIRVKLFQEWLIDRQ